MITHPEKIMFPDDGITKGDLAAYYETIADVTLPHLRGRPITMERYPAGIGKKGFWQKDVSKGFPDWHQAARRCVGRHVAKAAIADEADCKTEAHGKFCAIVRAVMAAKESPRPSSTPEIEENVDAIKEWDRALLLKRSNVETVSDSITLAAAGGRSMLGHVVWFGAWIAINTNLIPGITAFDPFPFQLLTMMVSLEAIFLALFVLASQNRLGKQADLRANLDLQIDLLVEREMTAVLQLLKDIAAHLAVDTSVTSDQLSDLIKKTDIKSLAAEVDRDTTEP